MPLLEITYVISVHDCLVFSRDSCAGFEKWVVLRDVNMIIIDYNMISGDSDKSDYPQ